MPTDHNYNIGSVKQVKEKVIKKKIAKLIVILRGYWITANQTEICECILGALFKYYYGPYGYQITAMISSSTFVIEMTKRINAIQEKERKKKELEKAIKSQTQKPIFRQSQRIIYSATALQTELSNRNKQNAHRKLRGNVSGNNENGNNNENNNNDLNTIINPPSNGKNKIGYYEKNTLEDDSEWDTNDIYACSDDEGNTIDMNEFNDDNTYGNNNMDEWLLRQYEQLLIETEQKIDILSTQINDLKSRRQEIKAFISNYNSTSKSTVESQYVNVFIKELRGSKKFKIEVNVEDTIKQVKHKIQKISQYKVQFRLIFANEQLEDDKCLNDYNIQPGSTLYLVLRLRGGCFIETTKILLPTTEQINICDIQIGDNVLTYNLNQNKLETHAVKSVLKYIVNELVKIRLYDQTAIICTASHPFYVPQKQNWCCIDSIANDSEYDELCVGDSVLNFKSELIEIINIEYIYINDGHNINVYTLHLDKMHNFYANGILVHNAMQIFVRTVYNKTPIILDVEPTELIENVKQKIRDQHKIRPEMNMQSFGLFFGTKELIDGKTLSDYKIPKESTLHLRTKHEQHNDNEDEKKQELEVTAGRPNRSHKFKISKTLTTKNIPKNVKKQFIDVFGYMKRLESIHGNAIVIDCNEKMKIINYNFKSDSKNEMLYAIRKRNESGWKMEAELYTEQEVKKQFTDEMVEIKLSKSIKLKDKFIAQLNHRDRIESILSNPKIRQKIIDTAEWHKRDKIPIITTKKKKK
eukprot:476011_1